MQPSILPQLHQFKILVPGLPLENKTILVKIDESIPGVFAGEMDVNRLSLIDSQGRLRAKINTSSPPVSLSAGPKGIFATLMGSYDPSDDISGSIIELPTPESGNPEVKDLVKDLPRPVHSLVTDVDGDGQDDIVVAAYGNYLGELAWYGRTSNGNWTKNLILEQPGALKSASIDLNGDGINDLVSLFAQGREALYGHINDGKGQFETRPLIEKHPAWGFSGFQKIDFDGDGEDDLLVTNGDNGDFGKTIPPFKPYHGIRLYLGESGEFKEAFFLPQNGAYKALAADFDGDGDMDIASISYFPDYRARPFESFIYYENQAGATFPKAADFKAHSFEDSLSGRWCVMDAGDIDKDGDLDLVLGSNIHGPTHVPSALKAAWGEQGNAVLILLNQSP